MSKLPKITPTKICYTWYWQCRKCGKENSYYYKRCDCKGEHNG